MENVKIRPSANITYPWTLSVEKNTYIGDEVLIYSLDKISIGANVSISHGAFLCAGTHDYNSPTFDLITKPIIIEDECWLAAECFINPGVTVAKGSVISPRSVVTKDTTPLGIYSGTPARLVKTRIIQPDTIL